MLTLPDSLTNKIALIAETEEQSRPVESLFWWLIALLGTERGGCSDGFCRQNHIKEANSDFCTVERSRRKYQGVTQQRKIL